MDYIDLTAQFITSDNALTTLAGRLVEKPWLAVDTEFIRTDTFFPIPALIQLKADDGAWFIDPVAICDFSGLKQVLESKTCLKIFHSMDADIELFQSVLGIYPRHLFDTQIAATLARIDDSSSYQNLVKALLDVELAKEETRSNWLTRPLSEQQHQYALDDVRYLPELWQQLQQRLRSLCREQVVEQECERLQAEIADKLDADPSRYYLKFSNAARLSEKRQRQLQAVCAWREKLARSKNVPRNRIVADGSLLEIVSAKIQNKKVVASILLKKRAAGTRYLSDILEQITESDERFEAEKAEDPVEKTAFDFIPVPANTRFRSSFQKMKNLVAQRATEEGLPRSFLAPNQRLEQLLIAHLNSSKQKPEYFTGWRWEVVGEDLWRLLDELSPTEIVEKQA